MCGICGKLRFDAGPVARDLLEAMCRRLVHRGPDAEGYFTAAGIGLGQRRLSVIDLRPQATPPLASEDGAVRVVFNGEIYNYRELREELKARGHRFATESDTEVLVHLYEDEGAAMVQRLRGMFAFALWDEGRKTLLAARDRLGQKPFCYARTAGGLVFASEIKAILADADVPRRPDFGAIDRYLTYGYVPAPLTAYEGIFKLPAGCLLTCGADGTARVERYWSPPLPPKGPSCSCCATAGRCDERAVEEELRDRLRAAVRSQLVSDVPLGAFLSGGIDSAAIVAAMAKEGGRVATFTVGFEDGGFDERAEARLIAERFGTAHQEFVVKPEAAALLPRLIEQYDEPFADSSALPTWYISQAARQAVTVALSGDGGDESFAGYDHYRLAGRWGAADLVPGAVRTLLLAPPAALLGLAPGGPAHKVATALRLLAADPRRRYLWQIAALKPRDKAALVTEQLRSWAFKAGVVDPPASMACKPGEDALAWMMRHDQSFYLPDCLMVKTDIASMAHGLEVRCPMLDHEFVEFAATIPPELKRRGGFGKAILRRALAGVLPEATLRRPKTGFAVPLARWLREDLRPLLAETLCDDRFARRGLFRPAAVRRMIDEHAAGRKDWSRRLWTLLVLELWFRLRID